MTALEKLYAIVPGTKDLSKNALAVLVFPKKPKGGLVIGGQFGEGAMRENGNTIGYARGSIVVMNSPAGEFAEDGGTLRIDRWNNYEYGVVRTDEGWRVNRILITYNADNLTSLPSG